MWTLVLKGLHTNEFPHQQPWPQQLGWYLEHQTGSKYLYIHRHWNKTRNLYHQAWTYPCYIQCSQNSLSNFLGQIVAKEKVTEKKIFCKILWYSKYYTEVLPKRFHLNGNNTGVSPTDFNVEGDAYIVYSHHYLVWEWKDQWVPLWLK